MQQKSRQSSSDTQIDDESGVGYRHSQQSPKVVSQNLRFELASPVDLQIEQLSEAWQELADHALEPNPIFTPMILKPALEKLVSHDQELALLQGWDGEKLIAIFALNAHPWKGKSAYIWSIWIHHYSFSSLPLIHSDYSVVVFEALFSWLEANSTKHVLQLTELPDEGPVYEALFQTLEHTKRPYYILNAHQRAVLRTDLSGEEYLTQKLKKKQRYNYRRQHRLLSEQGQLVESEISSDDDIHVWCDEFLALEASGWKGKRGTAVACRKEDVDYTREVLSVLHQTNNLYFWRLSLDDKPIAMSFCPRAGDRAWVSKIAYDETYARFSPGVLQFQEMTRTLCNDKTIKLVDSCTIPDHPMINTIWGERMGIHDILISTTTNPALFELTIKFEKVRRRLRLLAKNIYRVKGGAKS